MFHEHAAEINEQMEPGMEKRASSTSKRKTFSSSIEESTKTIETFGPFNIASESGNKMDLFVVDTQGMWLSRASSRTHIWFRDGTGVS
jgi:hypothetical protein